MDAFVIQGGAVLDGTIRIDGSKNASLPLMACALLTDEPSTLRDVPNLSDIRNMARLLRSLDCDIQTAENDPHTLTLHADPEGTTLAEYDIVRTMRAGICVLGPMLAKRGRAKVSMPGGCAIGDRPVDLHLRGMEKLGARLHLEEGYIIAEAPGGPGSRLRGTNIFLGGPNGSTVLGTINVMSAATLAEGRTVIESAACEPEVADVARLLTRMGAQIEGAGTPRITIQGVDSLKGTEMNVMPDRIVAGTYVLAGAITNGRIRLENFPMDSLTALMDRLQAVGVDLVEDPTPDSSTTNQELVTNVTVQTQRRLAPTHVVTQPHPGFPTDLQAQMMALLCLADGNSMITEKIFPDRFLHVAELMRMGADLTRSGPTVIVSGVRQLVGAPVMASDLRASAGLVLAALAAKGQTTINRIYHLDRGYQTMEKTLQALGANIERIDRPAV